MNHKIHKLNKTKSELDEEEKKLAALKAQHQKTLEELDALNRRIELFDDVLGNSNFQVHPLIKMCILTIIIVVIGVLFLS